MNTKNKGCNCLQESEEKMFDYIKEEMCKEGKIHSADKSKSKYVNTIFTFKKDVSRRPYMEFEFNYIPSRKDGTVGKSKAVKHTVTTSFCPFCGEKYPEENDTQQIENK